jgi:hypothetical protein
MADYKPLVAESVRATPAPVFFRDLADSSASAAAEQGKRQVSHRRLGLPAGEPDEIQIHIGRIEVTAVPPPAPPPASRPTSRSVSLDEYLRRRDGRAL